MPRAEGVNIFKAEPGNSNIEALPLAVSSLKSLVLLPIPNSHISKLSYRVVQAQATRLPEPSSVLIALLSASVRESPSPQPT